MATLENVVDSFFAKQRKRAMGEYLFNEIKSILGEEYSKYSNDQMRKLIREKFDQYNTSKPSQANSARSFDKNMRNWLTDIYKSQLDRVSVSIDRRNILTIACILHLNDVQCNRLLKKMEQHELHYGGDINETILTYCLKYGYDFNKATRLFSCYSQIKDHILYEDKETDVSFTGRTIKNKGKLILTVYGAFETDYVQLLKRLKIKETFFNEVKEAACNYCNDGVTEAFKELDYVLVSHLLIVDKNMSNISNKTFSYIEKMRRIMKGITSNTFYSLFYQFSSGKKFQTYTSIERVFSNCSKGYKDFTVKTQPTRDFILLFSTMIWCTEDIANISLSAYVDQALDCCGYALLDSDTSRIKDNFINELSKFSINKNKLKYENTELNINGSEINLSNRIETYKEIIKAFVKYTSDKAEPIMDAFELENNREDKFFIF